MNLQQNKNRKTSTKQTSKQTNKYMNKNDHMQQRQQQQNEILTQLNLNFNKIRGVLMWIEPNKPSFKCFI